MEQLLTIKEFCAAQGMCRRSFYNLLARGEGPEVIEIGRRRRISAEAAAAWRDWHSRNLSGDELARLSQGMLRAALPQLQDQHGSLKGLAVFAHQLGVLAEAMGGAGPAAGAGEKI